MIKEFLKKVLTKFQRSDKLLTVNQVAERTGIDRRMIYYYIQTNNLPAVRKYGKLLVKESDLENFKKD